MPQPKTPGFCLGRNPAGQTDSSSSKLEGSRTIDQVTIAALDGIRSHEVMRDKEREKRSIRSRTL
ncbi:hypothetical protein GBA52_012736 [Prunus armeniaca]|nr:hypothetical protein GBA52_012736 [Prunus armeniaca]